MYSPFCPCRNEELRKTVFWDCSVIFATGLARSFLLRSPAGPCPRGAFLPALTCRSPSAPPGRGRRGCRRRRCRRERIASILSSAPPLPPATMAPAWPMRRPEGAVRPAMKPAVGFARPFFASSLRNCAASSSAEPPISPIMMIDWVSGSERNHSSTSRCSVPLIGSPPMPTQVRLAEAGGGGLGDGLVGKGARARHNPDRAALVDVAGHDADLAGVRRDDAGAVRADEDRAGALEGALDLHHVEDGDALGDADDEVELGVDRLEDGVGGEGRRHVDRGGGGAGRLLGLGDGVEDREADVGLAALSGGDAADHPGAVGDGLLGVEGALGAGQALADDAGVLVDEDGHSVHFPWFAGRRRAGALLGPRRTAPRMIVRQNEADPQRVDDEAARSGCAARR